MSNYRITENVEKEVVVLPRRVQTLVDLYAKAGQNIGGDKKFSLRYQLETEDLLEKIFEDKLRLASKPDSLKILITAIYRVKHDNQEYYMYNYTRTFKNKMGFPERFSYDNFGHCRAPVVSLRFNQEKGTSLPEVTAYNHYFDLPWNKEAVQKLLKLSSVTCEQFFIGRSGTLASDPIADPYCQIQSGKDWLEGSFEDLMDLGRLGISYKEPSLYLVEPAKKQEKQNIEKNVGLRDKQGVYS